MRASEGQLKQVFADVFGVDVNTIGETTSIDTVERWDSMRHMNLVLALEDRFQVTLSEEQTLEILNYPLTRLVLEEHGVHFVATGDNGDG